MGINDPTNNYYNSHWIGSFVVSWVVGKLLQMVVVKLCGFIQLVWNFNSRVYDLSLTNFFTLQFILGKCIWKSLFKHPPIYYNSVRFYLQIRVSPTDYSLSHLSFFKQIYMWVLPTTWNFISKHSYISNKKKLKFGFFNML